MKKPRNTKKREPLLSKPQKKLAVVGVMTLPISVGLGHVFANVVRKNVPLEPAPVAVTRSTEHPSMKRAEPVPKPKKEKPQSTPIHPEVHERWAGMVLGEVGPDAPEIVWRKTARTLKTRMSMPGWNDKGPIEILDEKQFHALGSPTLETRKRAYSNEFNQIKKVIEEEHRRPLTEKDPTHFYTTRLLVDDNGKIIPDKKGNPIETNTNVPHWATDEAFVGEETWQPHGEPIDKGPVKIKFYRHPS